MERGNAEDEIDALPLDDVEGALLSATDYSIVGPPTSRCDRTEYATGEP
jgi:hypothetical protein